MIAHALVRLEQVEQPGQAACGMVPSDAVRFLMLAKHLMDRWLILASWFPALGSVGRATTRASISWNQPAERVVARRISSWRARRATTPCRPDTGAGAFARPTIPLQMTAYAPSVGAHPAELLHAPDHRVETSPQAASPTRPSCSARRPRSKVPSRRSQSVRAPADLFACRVVARLDMQTLEIVGLA